jgi:hypothetical protein
MIDNLLRRAAYLADKLFRQRRGDFRTMLWLTQHADGTVAQFETTCSAPEDIDDDAALAALRAELAADFEHDGVRAYACAYSARVTFVGVGCAPLATSGSIRRRAVVVEAHDRVSGLIGVHDIIADARPHLGMLQQSVRASGRFGGLLGCERGEAA